MSHVLSRAAVAATLLAGPMSADAQPAASPVAAESPDWTGLSDWIAAARSAGLDVQTGPLDLSTLSPREAVAVIGPEAPPADEALVRFVQEGGRLLVADEGAASDALFTRLGLQPKAAPRGTDPSLPGYPDLVVLTVAPFGVFTGLERLVTNHPGAFAPGPLDAAVGFASGDGFGYDATLGTGEFVAVADSSLFVNLMQHVPENARFSAQVVSWLAENGKRTVHVVAGADATGGEYAGIAPPDEALHGAQAFNRAVSKLANSRPNGIAIRFFVALVLAAACIYAVAVHPGLPGRRRRPGPRISAPRNDRR